MPPRTILKSRTHFPDARARVVVYRMPQQDAMRQHTHEFHELVLVLSGSGVHVTEGFRHTLEGGDVLVISRRRAHGYEQTQSLNLINILFRQDLLARMGRELNTLPGYHALFSSSAVQRRGSRGPGVFISRLRLTPGELAQMEEWANRLEAESRQSVQGGYLLAEAYLTLIIGVLCRRYRTGLGTAGGARNRLAAGGGLGKVLSWLEKNLEQPLRVADMARQAGMSERSFYRQFRVTMGCTPLQYLLRTRLQRAMERLKSAPASTRISEIAAHCGFEDSNYFTHTFRRHTGQSPRQFRAQRH